jgi:hypothetical protein
MTSAVMPKRRTTRFRTLATFLQGNGAFFLFFCLLSMLLLDFSTKIAMMNQGDYQRLIGFMLGSPIDVVPYDVRERPGDRPAFLWSYLLHPASPLTAKNSSAVYFWLMAKIQGLVQLDFNLYLVAFLSKAILLICCLRLAFACGLFRLPKAGRYLVLLAFALAFFYSHNIAILNSLYAEHAFVVGIAIFLAGIVERRRAVRIVLVSAGLLLAAASKPQFFYLPLLFILSLAAISLLTRRRPDIALLSALVFAQAISLLPLQYAPTKEVNYYHSLYFGSYVVLTPAELRSVHVRPGTLDCVGVDWWNWKIVGERTIDVAPAARPCSPPKPPLTLSEVLHPYFRYPFLLIRLAAWSLPDQFTVDYFEVRRPISYFLPSNGTSYRNGSTLIAASKLRDATVTRIWFVIVLAGLALSFLPISQSLELRALTLFLSLAVPTQIAMCLLGEGVRDLCKHLAGAQLCLDLLSMICLLHLISYLFRALRFSRI